MPQKPEDAERKEASDAEPSDDDTGDYPDGACPACDQKFQSQDEAQELARVGQ